MQYYSDDKTNTRNIPEYTSSFRSELFRNNVLDADPRQLIDSVLHLNHILTATHITIFRQYPHLIVICGERIECSLKRHSAARSKAMLFVQKIFRYWSRYLATSVLGTRASTRCRMSTSVIGFEYVIHGCVQTYICCRMYFMHSPAFESYLRSIADITRPSRKS